MGMITSRRVLLVDVLDALAQRLDAQARVGEQEGRGEPELAGVEARIEGVVGQPDDAPVELRRGAQGADHGDARGPGCRWR